MSGGGTRPCYLYRHFDAAGVLLYVGIAFEVPHRTWAHARAASWFPEISRIEVERFASREQARFAERRAIAAEGPLHNRPSGQWRRPRKKPDRLAFRLPKGQHAVLAGLAAADHRTLSSLVLKVLSDWLQTQAPPSQQVHQ